MKPPTGQLPVPPEEPRSRKTSMAPSMAPSMVSARSQFTMETGSESVYTNAHSARSENTIRREHDETDPDASFGPSHYADAQEALASVGSLSSHDVAVDPSSHLALDTATPTQSTFLAAKVPPMALSTPSRTISKGDDSIGSSEGKDLNEKEMVGGLSAEEKRILMAQAELPKPTPATMAELFRFTTRFELALNGLGLLAAIIAGAAQPLMTVVFGNLTTSFTQFATVEYELAGNLVQIEAARQALYATVNRDALLLVGIAAAMLCSTYAYMATWVYTGESTTRRIREKYLKAVLRQNVAYFDELGAGEVTTRIQTDTALIQDGISEKIAISVMLMSTFITGFVVALVRNWRLALVVSTIIPCIVGAGAIMNKFISEFRRLMLANTAEGGTLAEEVISSVRNTHAFGTQAKLTSLYDVGNYVTLQLGIRSARANGIGMGAFFFIIYSSYALAFYYGTTLILQGLATSGQIVTVFFSLLVGSFSLAQLAPNLQAAAFAKGAATAIYGTIDRVPIIDSSSTAGLKPTVEGRIEFSHVNFIYPSRPTVQVLYDFSAVFPRGKSTALVGASGSGKSTIIGLIERFYDPISGTVTLDGNRIEDLNLKALRTNIGLVSQEPTLFACTVAENIAHGLIGTPYADETSEQQHARIVKAAKQAHAHGFIMSLPGGYDCLIGERAILLSGGQKQRICIARAIVGDPAVLLLDEASSALDTNSERIVQAALDSASVGRTTIMIAHRLSTVAACDQLIVMTAGRVIESAMTDSTGSAHQQLLERPDGAYTRLVNAQRFKTVDAQETDSNDEADVALTNEQAEELTKNEKPEFETLKRTGTGRSAASEALEFRHKQDLENGLGSNKPRSFFYLFARMLDLNRDRKWEYVVGLVSSAFVGCVYPVFGIVFGAILSVFSETDPVALRAGGSRYALYCFIIALLASSAVAIQTYSFGSSAERLSRILRVRVFSSILRQDIAYFDKEEHSTGVLTSAVADHAQKIQGLFGVTLGVIIQSFFTIVAGSIIGLSYSWRIGLVGIACYPFTIAAGIVRLKVVVLKDVKNKKAYEVSSQVACEAAAAIRTVASLTREEDCMDAYASSLDVPMRNSNRAGLISNFFYAVSQSLTFLVIALTFWFGSRQLATNQVSTKGFFIVLISVVFASTQVGQVFTYVPDMSKARGAAAQVVQLIDAVPDIDADSPEGDKVAITGDIKFTNVHFRYPTRPHVRVLTGLNIEVKEGQFVAIVGASGCGKSTLIQLVERFYDSLSGTVTVGGHDISELNVQHYRAQISLVSQEPTLYTGTIRYNIALGAAVPIDEVRQEDVEQACRDANIHDFVMSLPDGYDTPVGTKSLSGGQKQRMAIARALIRNPKILLLDEATSALDSESEAVVQLALDKAAVGRSTIAVAHRLSTIQNADLIYVLQDGRVAEQGKHFELLALRGLYYDLVSQQDLEKRE